MRFFFRAQGGFRIGNAIPDPGKFLDRLGANKRHARRQQDGIRDAMRQMIFAT